MYMSNMLQDIEPKVEIISHWIYGVFNLTATFGLDYKTRISKFTPAMFEHTCDVQSVAVYCGLFQLRRRSRGAWKWEGSVDEHALLSSKGATRSKMTESFPPGLGQGSKRMDALCEEAFARRLGTCVNYRDLKTIQRVLSDERLQA